METFKTIEGLDFKLDLTIADDLKAIFIDAQDELDQKFTGEEFGKEDLKDIMSFLEATLSGVLKPAAVKQLSALAEKAAELAQDQDQDSSRASDVKTKTALLRLLPRQASQVIKLFLTFPVEWRVEESRVGYMRTVLFRSMRKIAAENISNDHIITLMFSHRHPEVYHEVLALAYAEKQEAENTAAKKKKASTVKSASSTKKKKVTKEKTAKAKA